MTHCFPSGPEVIPMCFVGCFAYLLPLLFGVFVVVYLVKIASSLDKIQKRLDNLEQPPKNS